MFTNINDLPDLEEMIRGGYIIRSSHQEHPFFIFNYTAKAQYEKMWNEVTQVCRGLITTLKGEIIARPFRKFFNYGEVEDQIPIEPFEVYEKMDGSLGISYPYRGKMRIATRGSFHSEMAVRAEKILAEKYSHVALYPNMTYCWEILYPENRIVVDYGQREDLILLAVFHTHTGLEYPPEDLPNLGFPTPQRFQWDMSFEDMGKIQIDNFEGVVIRFQSGYRVKVKLDEYVRLHRILTGATKRHIWEFLKDGKPLSSFIRNVPEEFETWIKKQGEDLIGQYWFIQKQAEENFHKAYAEANTDERKKIAEQFKKYPHAPILFNMLDGKSYSDYIWKQIYPPAEKPFRQERDL